MGEVKNGVLRGSRALVFLAEITLGELRVERYLRPEPLQVRCLSTLLVFSPSSIPRSASPLSQDRERAVGLTSPHRVP